MAKMEDFIAFRAAIGLLKSEGKETLIKETYQDCLRELKLPISKMKNRVLKIYADYSDEDISSQISKILKEKRYKNRCSGDFSDSTKSSFCVPKKSRRLVFYRRLSYSRW
jgi:amidophosphoribosyltransferase